MEEVETMTYAEYAEWKDIEILTIMGMVGKGFLKNNLPKIDGKFQHVGARIIIDENARSYVNQTCIQDDPVESYCKMIMDYLNATRY